MLKEHCCASLYWHSVVQHFLQCLSVTNTAVKSTVCVCKLHYSPCSIVPISHSLSSVLSPFLFKLAFRETTVYYPFIQKIALHPKSHILYTAVHTHTNWQGIKLHSCILQSGKTHTHKHTQRKDKKSADPRKHKVCLRQSISLVLWTKWRYMVTLKLNVYGGV